MERMKGRDGKREMEMKRKGRKVRMEKKGREMQRKMGMERENWRERRGRNFGRNRRL